MRHLTPLLKISKYRGLKLIKEKEGTQGLLKERNEKRRGLTDQGGGFVVEWGGER